MRRDRPHPIPDDWPFFHDGLWWSDGPYVVPEGTPDAIWLRGRVLDGAGDPVPDALIETWQADPRGRFDHPDDPRGRVRGFGCCPTDAGGCYAILTTKPGRVSAPDGSLQAPHIDISVFARGLLDRVITRLCFDDEEANATDFVLSSVVDDALRARLVARSSADGYDFDIRLQGEDASVFFTV